ncbi:MAG TPA: MotA/TolQ/ExbB proton channel family protein [Candidatus Kapabacteria bacterium]|nr:MotA/TolQ/ExbB proton channel family protein [Candidatus Kapabacteria bacterium]
MKNLFNVIVITLSFVVAYSVYYLVMGNPNNFNDPEIKHEPKAGNVLGTIYTGGPLVGLLLSFILISITFVFERFFSISKANGKGNPSVFIKDVINHLTKGDLDAAVSACDNQRGSMANVLRSAILRFKDIEHDPEYSGEKKISEIQRAIDEAMNLETPLLEKNLVILSTVASVATMVGLLGTTVGMIRAFQALALSGTVSAVQLSLGISEALYNTAGGLIGAILSIVFYNFFTTKVDNFIYMIDEAILNITQIFTIRIKN